MSELWTVPKIFLPPSFRSPVTDINSKEQANPRNSYPTRFAMYGTFPIICLRTKVDARFQIGLQDTLSKSEALSLLNSREDHFNRTDYYWITDTVLLLFRTSQFCLTSSLFFCWTGKNGWKYNFSLKAVNWYFNTKPIDIILSLMRLQQRSRGELKHIYLACVCTSESIREFKWWAKDEAVHKSPVKAKKKQPNIRASSLPYRSSSAGSRGILV